MLNKKSFGLALGILWGACLFVCTLWVMWRGGGNHFYLLEQFYPGYQVSVFGAFVGLAYGLVEGFISGWLFAWLYNQLGGKKK